MSRPYKNLSNHVFGRLTVISFSHVGENKHAYWDCVCSCGSSIKIRSDSLKRKNSMSCGCSSSEEKSKRFTGDGLSSARYIYAHYKLGAKRRNHVFELSFEQFLEITQQNCTYCNRKPFNKSKGDRANTFIYSGIDRRDNSIGYTIKNCYPCCKQCNQAKHAMTHEEFLDLCRMVVDNWNNDAIRTIPE